MSYFIDYISYTQKYLIFSFQANVYAIYLQNIKQKLLLEQMLPQMDQFTRKLL